MSDLGLKFFFSLTFYFLVLKLFSQGIPISVISSAGNYSNTPLFSIESNIGEVLVETITTANNVLTQGFEQPDPDVLTHVIDFPPSITRLCQIYPNPTSNYVWIFPFEQYENSAIIKIVNVSGAEIFNSQIDFSFLPSLVIDLSHFSSGMYFMTIAYSGSDSVVDSFKIIKQ